MRSPFKHHWLLIYFEVCVNWSAVITEIFALKDICGLAIPATQQSIFHTMPWNDFWKSNAVDLDAVNLTHWCILWNSKVKLIFFKKLKHNVDARIILKT